MHFLTHNSVLFIQPGGMLQRVDEKIIEKRSELVWESVRAWKR